MLPNSVIKLKEIQSTILIYFLFFRISKNPVKKAKPKGRKGISRDKNLHTNTHTFISTNIRKIFKLFHSSFVVSILNFQYSRPTFKLLSEQNLSLNIIETISPYFSPFSDNFDIQQPASYLERAVYLRHPVFVCRERIRPANPGLRYRPICILRSCSHRSRGLFAALYSYDRIKRTSSSRNEQSCSIQPTRS